MQITATSSIQTFLFADIVAFTAITEQEGDLRATELAVTLAVTAADAAADAGGELVKAIGDAVMVRVPDARRALDMAIALRRELASIPGFPGIHVGLHTGPAVCAGGDWYGHTVNLAARVTCAAGAGEIYCTQATLAAAGRPDGLHFAPCGRRAFKNATRRMRVFNVETVTARPPLAFRPEARVALIA